MSLDAPEATKRARYEAMVESRRTVARAKRERVMALLTSLAADDKCFSIAWLAREAEVSTSYLYRTPVCRSVIGDARKHPADARMIHDDGLDAECRAEVALRKENARLKRRIVELERIARKIPVLKTQLNEARKQLNTRYAKAFEDSESR